jgi:hypothetical protein
VVWHTMYLKDHCYRLPYKENNIPTLQGEGPVLLNDKEPYAFAKTRNTLLATVLSACAGVAYAISPQAIILVALGGGMMIVNLLSWESFTAEDREWVKDYSMSDPSMQLLARAIVWRRWLVVIQSVGGFFLPRLIWVGLRTVFDW